MHDVRRFRNSEQQVYRVLTYRTMARTSVRHALTTLLIMTALSVYGNGHANTAPDTKVNAAALADFGSAVCNIGLFSSTDTIHTFSIGLHNIGTATLEIYGTDTSCSCTSVSLSDSCVTPGDSATITVTYNAADKWPGIINQSARISCSASDSPINIRITGFMYDNSTEPDSITRADWPIFAEPQITKL